MKKENIKLNNIKGTWYVIDEVWYNSQKVYLLESEQLGDEVPCIITDKNFNIIKLNAYNGFDDLD